MLCAHTVQTCLDQKGKEACTHQAASLNLFWPWAARTTGSNCTHMYTWLSFLEPTPSQAAHQAPYMHAPTPTELPKPANIQSTQATLHKTTFSILVETAMSPNSEEQTHKNQIKRQKNTPQLNKQEKTLE